MGRSWGGGGASRRPGAGASGEARPHLSLAESAESELQGKAAPLPRRAQEHSRDLGILAAGGP